MEIKLSDTQKTKELAFKLAQKIVPGMIFMLYGDLGSGKTTFVRYVVESLGISSRVQSPTFVIVRKYSDESAKGQIKQVFHADLYRLNDKEQIMDLGLSEMAEEENSVMFIEWPELGENEFKNGIRIYFETTGETERVVKLEDKYV